MLEGASGLSKYMDIMLKSDFPQVDLLDAKRFSDFLTKHGMRISLNDLEYYDEKGIIRPALRLNRPLAEEGPMKYAGLSTDIFSIQQMYREGLIELPKDNDFQTWETYHDGDEEKTWLYYHPFQFVPVRRLAHNKEQSDESLQVSQRVSIETWIPRVGLLLLLEQAYYPLLGRISINPFDSENFVNKWREWRLEKFSPHVILRESQMTIEQVKAFYDSLASDGHTLDPLANWYPLLRLIKRSKKEELKKEALLAQSYYDMATMVAHFIYDLTKEKMTEPDDLFDGTSGSWKERRYGSPFSYSSKKTKRLIQDDYFIGRPYFVAIVFEGETEQVVIEKIFDALYIDPDRHGIALYNAEGSGNLESKNLDGLISLAKDNQIDVYLIIDNDANAKDTLAMHRGTGNVKDGMFTIWERDFEYDNFGVNNVVAKVNEILNIKGLIPITDEEVERRMQTNHEVLMKAVNNIVGKMNNGTRLSDVLSKRKLAEELIAPRIEDMRRERNGEGWNPSMKIEFVLQCIFAKIPPFTL